MLKARIMPVNDDILKTFVNPQRVIALYGDFSEKINVGYPSKAAYRPIEANMWGYKEAKDKGLYVIVDDNYYDSENKIYDVVIDNVDRNIVISMDLVKEFKEETNEENKEEIKEVKIYDFVSTKQKRRALR